MGGKHVSTVTADFSAVCYAFFSYCFLSGRILSALPPHPWTPHWISMWKKGKQTMCSAKQIPFTGWNLQIIKVRNNLIVT